MKTIIRTFRERNVYVKTMISFALVLCIVSVVVLPFFFHSEKLLRSQYIDSSISRIDGFLSEFERECQMVSTQGLNLYSDEELFELSQKTVISYRWSNILSIRETKRKITQIAECSIYVDEITVYLPWQEREITNGFYYEPMNRGLYETLLSECLNGQKRFVKANGNLYTCYARNTRHGSQKCNDYLIAIRWNEAQIREAMAELLSPDRTGGAAFVGSRFGGLCVDDSKDWMEGYRYGERFASGGYDYLPSDAGKQLVLWKNSDELMTTLVVCQDGSAIFPWTKLFILQNIAIVITILLCALLFLLLMRGVISTPLKALKKLIRQNEQTLGLLPAALEGDDFEQLFSSYQNLIGKTMQLREENYKQQLLVKNSQLKQMQSQINPHFLFNSLLCASSLVNAGEDEQAVQVLSHLSGYYEYLTREAADERTLRQEHDHVLDYIRVQTVRFGERFRCDIAEPPEDCLALRLPRLTLQPIVENCFMHAFRNMTSGGMLTIRYDVGDGCLLIRIENNGGVDDETLAALSAQPEVMNGDGEITGLTNVHLRLKYRFGANAGLSFARGAMGGLEVTVKVPTEMSENNDQTSDC